MESQLFSVRRLSVAGLVVLLIGLVWVTRKGEHDHSNREAQASGAIVSATPKESPKLSPSAAPTAGTPFGLSLAETKELVRQKLALWNQTKTEDEAARQRLLEELEALVTQENAPELTKMLSEDELSAPFGLFAFGRWLEANPQDAAKWIAVQPGANDLHANRIAQRFLSDENGLRAYCAALPNIPWKQTFLSEASLLVVAKNPAYATEIAQQMNPGKEQTNALETVIYDWATRDISGAVGAVEKIADPALRERTLVMTAKAIAIGDPDLGAQWLSMAVKSEGALKEAATSIVEIWAEKSPTEAAAWLSRSAHVEQRAEAVNALVRAWAKVDPHATQAWIQSLPERERVEAMLREEQAERERPKD
ncbi:MAG: hypothetical protein QM790_20465 [Nibricoccus sp.]